MVHGDYYLGKRHAGQRIEGIYRLETRSIESQKWAELSPFREKGLEFPFHANVSDQGLKKTVPRN